MSEPVATNPAAKYELHPKVGMSVLAGALTTVVIGALKSTGLVDLSGYESQITVIVMGVIGYLVPSPL